ncbi:pyrroline-5-carboxylate reductase [Xylaria bambusicola]|uniref:pyrroline-5-carboxylate reductase n=1 Tax=Xylaria bambusicola TaxID=326684 RepID=UPI002008B29D|nr:pyrroline-5-carboxylate reductase [Xylaria bambusicola]KAI0526331.1 pyrroline-5-carboxylate reductase [Xylaria bambusicola]
MLAITQHAHEAADLTMAVLGCGSMGVAILSGILSSLQEMSGPRPLQTSGNSTPRDEVPSRLPSRFIACVRRPESAKRVKQALWEHSASVKVVQKDNVAAVMKAEVILLACKPNAIEDLLNEPGMTKALHGKLLISICAGVTVQQLEIILHGAVPVKDPEVDGRCRIVRACPNTTSTVRESMTVIADSEPPLPPQTSSLVTWIFKRIGDVVYLPAAKMNASTALCASGPAFFSLMLEAAIDGAVAMGLPRAEATRMAAQTMRGTAGLVLSGEHPALVREKVCTPGGCSIGGLLVLEEAGVRGTVSKAVREAACVASQLGQGQQGVNGTKH